jgi:Na+-exporting ATPase
MSKEQAQAARSQSSNDTINLSQPAHALTFHDVLNQLGTNCEDGLTSSEAKQRLDKYGGNMLEGDEGVSFAKIFIRQIANAMILVSTRQIYRQEPITNFVLNRF